MQKAVTPGRARVGLIDPNVGFHDTCRNWLVQSESYQLVSISTSLTQEISFDLGRSVDTLLVALDGRPADAEMVGELRRRCAVTKVIVLMEVADWSRLAFSIQAGARGCMLRPTEPTRLLDALDSVLTAGVFLCPCVQELLLTRLRGQLADTASVDLTPREREILLYLLSGHDNKQIMSAMHLEHATVATHVHHILVKFGVHSRRQLVDRYFSS